MISRLTTLFTIFALALPVPVMADIVIAARTIRAQTVIMASDLAVKDGDMAGFAGQLDQVVGQESRVALYEGRPIRLGDIGPPAVIRRNEIVPLVFQKNGLQITAEGRSLSRAAPGERVRVMNMTSRTTISGWAGENGTVYVTD